MLLDGMVAANGRHRSRFLGTDFDHVGFDDALQLIGAAELRPFRYVVTPNVDHVVRNSRSRELKRYYESAWLCLCDSKPITMLSRSLSRDLPHVTGSDITAALFATVIGEREDVALIAANEQTVADLRRRFPRIRFRAHVPPPGVLKDLDAFARCVQFSLSGSERFIFIAIGSPQSERIAYELSRHEEAHGVALCVGASLEFIVGSKRRAPVWARKLGLEWVHRLASEPRRLWRRYLSSVIPLMRLFLTEIRTAPKVRQARL